MEKTHNSSNRWALAGLFKRINLGDDPKLLRSEASYLVEKVDSDDIAAAQKTLMNEGYSEQLVQKIAEAFVMMGLPKKHAGKKEPKCADNHILQKMSVEHSMTRCYLEDLKQIADEIDGLETLTNVSSEFRRLSRLVEYFLHFKRHLQREEDVIFPYLKKFGWKGLCKSDENEHKKILADIDNLLALISSLGLIDQNRFNDYLQKIVRHFVPLLRDHLTYEDEVLWPIALVIIDDDQVWETIKAVCDEFEY